MPRSSRTIRRDRSPTATEKSFLWTRRAVLTFLTAFTLLPVFVMVTTSLKPLQDVSGKFRWAATSSTR